MLSIEQLKKIYKPTNYGLYQSTTLTAMHSKHFLNLQKETEIDHRRQSWRCLFTSLLSCIDICICIFYIYKYLGVFVCVYMKVVSLNLQCSFSSLSSLRLLLWLYALLLLLFMPHTPSPLLLLLLQLLLLLISHTLVCVVCAHVALDKYPRARTARTDTCYHHMRVRPHKSKRASNWWRMNRRMEKGKRVRCMK